MSRKLALECVAERFAVNRFCNRRWIVALFNAHILSVLKVFTMHTFVDIHMRWQVTFSEETPGIDLESINHSSQVNGNGPRPRPTLLEKFENPPRPLDESPTTHCKVPGH